MRDRLVANVSDFLKLAFLRAIACNDRSLGVAWYYVPAKEWPVEDRRSNGPMSLHGKNSTRPIPWIDSSH